MNGKHILDRIQNSSVAWAWLFNGFRLASGIILLPLLLQLPKEEQGIYHAFIRLVALVPIIDFGFSATMARYVSYAMSGATELKAQGMVKFEKNLPPNKELIWRLFFTCRNLYRCLSVATFLLLGSWGTYTISLNVHETPNPSFTWAAWGITLLAAALETYFGWWNVFLRSMNEVTISTRIAVFGSAIYLMLAGALLFFGYGLLSIPIAILISTFWQRILSRKKCLKLLGKPPLPNKQEPSLFPIIWPNSWRIGLQLLSSYLAISLPPLIFYKIYGSAAFAEYGLSAQLIGICSGMAAVWIYVKWPLINQLCAKNDHQSLRRLLWPRIWLQIGTFLAMAGFCIVAAPYLLELIEAKNRVISTFWFALLALNSLFAMQFSFWATLLTAENRVPSLWPTVITNLFTLLSFIGIIKLNQHGIAALILAPLISGCLFNYWYWPKAASRVINADWPGFLFRSPKSESAEVHRSA